MSSIEKAATFQRLLAENRVWALLRADTAPLIMAFGAQYFSAGQEVPIADARTYLQDLIAQWRDLGHRTQEDAGALLRRWFQEGHFREHEYMVTMTDSLQSAIRFAQGLSDRDLGATASHLRVVQEAVESLSIEITGDFEHRRQMLLRRKADIEADLHELEQGRYPKLSTQAKAERLREVIFLSRLLTQDFRYLEDEMERVNRETCQHMVRTPSQRHAVLSGMLDQDDLVDESTAGVAFNGFYGLLCDDYRATEFREQCRRLAAEADDADLPQRDRQFLARLVASLTDESKRILKRRARMWESLCGFVTRLSDRDDLAIESLLNEITGVALTLHQQPDFRLLAPVDLWVPSGKVRAASPMALKLADPQTPPPDLQINEVDLSTEIPDELLDRFYTVNTQAVAASMLPLLRDIGPMSLKALSLLLPVTEGIEEVVARLRIAYFTGAVALDGPVELLEFTERDGTKGLARVPLLHLSKEGFPSDLKDLPL